MSYPPCSCKFDRKPHSERSVCPEKADPFLRVTDSRMSEADSFRTQSLNSTNQTVHAFTEQVGLNG